MKKLVAAIATACILLIGTAAINISANEYKVQEQDTLWEIAQKNNTSVQHLADINGLDTVMIYPDQKLTIEEEELAVEIYTVKSGDTLSGISNKYNVSVDEIKEWNELSSTLIIIGQELEINTNSQNDNETKVEASTDSVEDYDSKVESETISVTATAYTAECKGCSGVTYTGIDLNADRHKKVIAVDPNVIPLGSEVYVEGYGKAIAGDIGGAIKGNKIDIHVPTKSEAYSWGVQTVDVTILN